MLMVGGGSEDLWLMVDEDRCRCGSGLLFLRSRVTACYISKCKNTNNSGFPEIINDFSDIELVGFSRYAF